MILPAVEIPLREDDTGTLRVGASRVTLDTIVGSLRRGDSPEMIAQGFPTLTLAQIHAVIAYYLQHQTALDAYLQQQRLEGEQLRSEIEAKQGESELVKRALKILQERHKTGG
jgi:uncharacterized protein (DUF433 family)